MKQILSGDSLVITPDEGHVLAFSGGKPGRVMSKLIVPKNFSLEKIVEIPYSGKNIVQTPAYVQDQENLRLDEFKQYIITQTKILLEDYLKQHPMPFNGKFYNVSSEAQSHLLSMIKAGEMAQSLNENFSVYWGAKGEVRQEWTLSDLKSLFIKIQAYVNKYVIQQQVKEQDILNAPTKEILLALDLNYYD